MREQPKIPEEQLRACFQDQYDLYPVTLEFLPLGLDYNAGVYRVVSEQGTAYLLKVTSRPLYEPRCLVPRYLNDQGITSVVAPIPTRSGALWTKLVDWTLIVFEALLPAFPGRSLPCESWTDAPPSRREERAKIHFHHVANGGVEPQRYAPIGHTPSDQRSPFAVTRSRKVAA